MISKTIGFFGVHDIFRHTQMGPIFEAHGDRSSGRHADLKKKVAPRLSGPLEFSDPLWWSLEGFFFGKGFW